MSDASTRPYAVVTGGSNGIGLELARQFARNGYDVLIAAENPGHLSEAARQLSADGTQITTHAADLSREDGVRSLYEALRSPNRPVDVLCVNAGIGLGGAFAETDLETELKMIDLNVRGAVQLTKYVLKDMVARNSGKLLFTSSIAATMPDPFEAVYGGTKVFLRWFGEALRNELKDTDIGVTVLMPGVTDTNFFNRADMLDTKVGASKSKDDPAVVAKAAFDALQSGKDRVTPTLKNKIMGTVADGRRRGTGAPGPVGAVFGKEVERASCLTMSAQYTCPAGKLLQQFLRNYAVAHTDSAHDGIRKYRASKGLPTMRAQGAVLPEHPDRKVLRSVHEEVRDQAHPLAGTP
ncbi:SDR family NAD(P)-dependent oxidoreductase [Microvirga zambiensis]|uniref:SDR family NAD(P)-dependent oxidoreductase n=1 Tax=Microvirga zambiensis TaxID=1402137 RepID=UPI0031B5F6C7